MTPAVSQATCKKSFPDVNESLQVEEIRPGSGFSRRFASGNQLAFTDTNVSGKPLQVGRVCGDPSREQTQTEALADPPAAEAANSGANRRLGRRTALQTSRVVRACVLVLIFLFPLLSLVQLRDTDDPWRLVAQDIRPSVVTLVREDGAGTLCGVVIQIHPLRVATVGTLAAGGIHSVIEGDKVRWSPILVDDEKQFTILQADPDQRGESEGASSFPFIQAARLDLAGTGELREDVKAALVGPDDLSIPSLWVGVLRAPDSMTDSAMYKAHLLRQIPEVAGVATSAAWAEVDGEIDPRLRGAPFVDEQGRVVALYLDRDLRRVRAIPIEFISRSLVFLHLQAAQ